MCGCTLIHSPLYFYMNKKIIEDLNKCKKKSGFFIKNLSLTIQNFKRYNTKELVISAWSTQMFRYETRRKKKFCASYLGSNNISAILVIFHKYHTIFAETLKNSYYLLLKSSRMTLSWYNRNMV